MRTLLLTLTTCLLVLPVQAKYSGGSGTAQDPYQIATAADLIALGETPADYGKHFVLTADIDLDPNLPGRKVFDKAVIAPDMDAMRYLLQGTPFTGVFDGGGHTISHLTVKGSGWLGLFGQLEWGAKITNLGLEAVYVNGTGVHVGSLVGWNDGDVTHCYSTGSVSGIENVGGLLGYNDDGVVTDCYSTGAVSGNECAGGLVGANQGTVTRCYSTGAVSGRWRSGGLAGLTFSDYWGNPQGIVTACFWDTQTSGRGGSAGGAGKTTAEMQDPNTFMAAGWGFSPHDIWFEPEGGGYPILWWQLSPWPTLPTFSGGSGEPDDPYLLSTAEQLNSIGHNPRLMTCHFKLVDDLDLTGFRFHPIGGDTPYSYRAVFDGNRHTISHLTITGKDYVGLFGELGSGAEVKDLGVVDVNVTSSGYRVGGLVGAIYGYGTVTNCYSTGAVSGGKTVGGLVGDNVWHGVVTECYSTGAVTGNNVIGGLLGCNGGVVTDCYSTGAVSSSGWNVGGLVGTNWDTVTHCYSTGAVTGDSSIGGLVGSNGGTVTHCYSTGVVTGDNSIGGLVGENYEGTVTNCYSTGAVSGGNIVGGLVGDNVGTITNSYATASVAGVSSVGGLAGTNGYCSGGGMWGPERCYAGVISDCYSVSAVKGTALAGGLLGTNGAGEITGCFWDTEISGQAKSGGGTGKTTAQMQTAKTFLSAKWDFVGEAANGTEDIWWILEGKDYPRLWWEAAPAEIRNSNLETRNKFQ